MNIIVEKEIERETEREDSSKVWSYWSKRAIMGIFPFWLLRRWRKWSLSHIIGWTLAASKIPTIGIKRYWLSPVVDPERFPLFLWNPRPPLAGSWSQWVALSLWSLLTLMFDAQHYTWEKAGWILRLGRLCAVSCKEIHEQAKAGKALKHCAHCYC